MKLQTTLTIFYSAFILSIEGACDTNADACSAESAFITIACSLLPTATCEITLEVSDPANVEVDVGGITEISAPVCKTKCEEQKKKAEDGGTAAKQCKYYRWEETEGVTSCYMMTECETMLCEGEYCSSGQIGCTEPGEETTCGGKIAYDSSKVHIECGKFPTGDLINIYVDEFIPSGTICKTTHKCDKWEDPGRYSRKLAVECNPLDGLWKLSEGTGGLAATTEMISSEQPVGTTLLEQPCDSECVPLILITENLIKPGTDLFCEQELTNTDPSEDKNTLVNGNSCILLCDNHLTMSISCQFTHGVEADGSKKWQNEDGIEVKEDDVKCWHY